jgi:two-component system, NarL family, sensor kinase
VRPPGVAAPAEGAAGETERVVAWLRLPAIALFAAGEALVAPNPDHVRFIVALALFSAWSVGMLAWTHLRPVGGRLAIAATIVDVAAITALTVYSGGGFSHARLAYFLVPVTAAFRLQPWVTGAAAALTTSAYMAQAFAQRSSSQPGATRHIVVEAGFLAWVGLASVLLSLLLERRTRLASSLAEQRTRLLADALEAEQRERQVLAEALHDHALQNLLSARHELQEAGEAAPHPALARADGALAATVTQLREAVFELHPYVLEQAGLELALRSIAQDAAHRARLDLKLDLRYEGRHPNEPVLFSAARELLANVVQHAHATRMTVHLADADGHVELVVEDNGCGFRPERLTEQLAGGHIGLASQRVRLEAAGGSMQWKSSPGAGTRVVIRLPDRPPR